MEAIISSTKLDIKTKKEKSELTVMGQFYSIDRYYTWLNEEIDYRLVKKYKFLYLLISFLMRSTNFKHNSQIRKNPKWILIFDVIGWLCMIGFVICLILGLATPLITAIGETIKFTTKPDSSSINLEEAWKKAFINNETITSLIFTFIMLILGIIYIYIIKKIIPKNKSLSIKDYVNKKIEYLIKFGIIKKSEGKLKKEFKKMQKKLNIKIKNDFSNEIMFNRFEVLNDTDKWQTLQITNIVFRIFNDFRVILKIDDLDNETFNVLNTIINNDFKYLKITKF